MKRRTRKGMIFTIYATMLSVGAFSPVTAGTAVDPEITDRAGDANFIQSIERDTRPASVDSADILAVWFETAFTSYEIRDPDTGKILRVGYVPSALRVHLRTTAPVQPTWQNQAVNYQIQAVNSNSPGLLGWSAFLLRATPGQAADTATIYYGCFPCQETGIPGSLSYAGNVATFSFPFSDERVAERFGMGTTLRDPRARSWLVNPVSGGGPAEFGSHPNFDASLNGAGKTYTVGSDIPPDVDCTATPTHPECSD